MRSTSTSTQSVPPQPDAPVGAPTDRPQQRWSERAASAPFAAIISARTGRDLARQRLILGATIHAVAQALGIHDDTLRAWERDATPFTAASGASGGVHGDRRARWRLALTQVATMRAQALARAGFALRDLPPDLARLLIVLGAIERRDGR